MHALIECMKLTKTVFILCCLFCFDVPRADAMGVRTVKGVVMTPDGTVVPEFTVLVRPMSDKPELVQRKNFKNGEFMIDELEAVQYQFEVNSPLYIRTKLLLDLRAKASGTDYSIVILYPYRNEARLIPGAAHTVSAKSLQQKIPAAAREAYAKGVQLHWKGELNQALIEYGRALRAYPEYLEALTDIGAIFLLYNRPEAALTFLRRAQNVDDSNPIINLNIAVALAEQSDYANSTKLLKKILQGEPRMASAQLLLARIDYLQKKYDQAEVHVRQALDNDPKLLDAWLLMIDVSYGQKKYDQVREALRHVRDAMSNQRVSDFIDEQLLTVGS
jgi:tetratricopeptide (TPR) repeat protein